MRNVSLFAFAMLASTQSYATDNIIPPPTSLNTDIKNVANNIIPTLLFDQTNSDDIKIGINHPTLPASNFTWDAKSTGKSSTTVSGYILNRQLVEQIARPFPQFGVLLGQGWNSFLNRQSANICIEGDIEELPGTELNSSFSGVEDRASYLNAISGSAGGSYGPFSGSGSYSKERKFSSYDANVVLNVVVDSVTCH